MTDDVREKIIASATQLFAENGFGKASMNDIVRASGLSKGGVYWHFKGKDEIVHAIFERFFEAQLIAFQMVIEQTELTVTEKLLMLARLGGDELESFAAQFPSSLEFYALAARDDALRERLTHFFTRYRDLLSPLVKQGIESGEWREVDPSTTADSLIALFEGVILVWGVKPDQFNLEDQLTATLSLLLDGLRKKGE